MFALFLKRQKYKVFLSKVLRRDDAPFNVKVLLHLVPLAATSYMLNSVWDLLTYIIAEETAPSLSNEPFECFSVSR